MNGTDKRLLKAILGGLGMIGSTFAKNAEIAIPVAFESAVLSGIAIVLDTFEMEEHPPEKKPAPKQESKGAMTLTIPAGHSVKIEPEKKEPSLVFKK